MKNRKTSIRGNLVREFIGNVIETSLGEPIQTGKFRKHPIEPSWKCPSGYSYEKIEMENFEMEYLKPEGASNGKIVLQLHGGGYIGPMKNVYRRFAINYSEIMEGGDVLTIDYRVAPENPYPAALNDAIVAYKWLVEKQKYNLENLIVVGDSAGGGLALALCLYLRDNFMSLPAGVVLMSPWTDLTNSGASYTDNFDIDPLFGRSTNNMLYNSTYIGNEDPYNPYISPVYGDFNGFPPMLMQVGTHEVLLSDTLTVAERANAQNGNVKLSVYEGMFHVFQMVGDMIPESKDAWNEVSNFIRKDIFKK
ncbi:MAG: alpha/beta hydrolase [Clostridium sp.]|uniref:alpha/beta hydrolase n=1 Tax=Clostridium sp. TaxID=1506 RepID=UPI0030731BBD